MVRNVLTIDVEDWYHVCGIAVEPDIPPEKHRVAATTGRILDVLKQHGVTATFFVLGSVAEAEPDLLRRIATEGHEIASHGWSHTLVSDLSRDEFVGELLRTEEVIQTLTGTNPVGFRAPQWSVSTRTPWVHEVLAERGYWYDSSLNPLPIVGDPGGSRVPYRIDTPAGSLWEVPPLVTPTLFGNLPTGGGWGFRFFPFPMVERGRRALNQQGHPAVIYLHPRDVDPSGPRLKISPLRRFVAYGPATDAVPRLERLLTQNSFATIKELVAGWHTVS